MRTRIALGLIITGASMAVTIGLASASTKSGVRRTLSRQEASALFGGVKNKKCDVDPRCGAPCNINYEVASCYYVEDFGSCLNATTSQNAPSYNQRRCLLDATGWGCTEGPDDDVLSCRSYFTCEWDYANQQCQPSPGGPTRCFPFPKGCANGPLGP